MRKVFNDAFLNKVMKRLRMIVLYAAGFYQFIEIISLYGYISIQRNHPIFFVSNFSAFHLVSICILFSEYKKQVLHLNLFMIINTIWLLIISWNVVFITTLGKFSFRDYAKHYLKKLNYF